MSTRTLSFVVLVAALGATGASHATGACPIPDAGPRTQWQDQAALEKKLTAGGWKVRRIKIDGQCFEVYAIDDKGRRVEAYFDPRTLDPAVPAKKS